MPYLSQEIREPDLGENLRTMMVKNPLIRPYSPGKGGGIGRGTRQFP